MNEGEKMINQIVQYPIEAERVRLDLIKYLSNRGVMQSWVANKCKLSNCSISLFLSSKRLLVPDKLKIIESIIYTYK